MQAGKLLGRKVVDKGRRIWGENKIKLTWSLREKFVVKQQDMIGEKKKNTFGLELCFPLNSKLTC